MMVNWEFMDNQTPESADPARRRPARRQGGPLHPRPAGSAPGARPSACSPASPTTSPTRARPPVPPRWSASTSPASNGWTAPTRRRSGSPAAPTSRDRGGRAGRHVARRVRDRRRGGQVTDILTPVLTDNWDARARLDAGGLRGPGRLRRAEEGARHGARTTIITAVKDSGLRGRGGAGFPTGMKWGFIPQDNPKPKYLVVNADESEPGTCKDIPLMMASPHTLVEGVDHQLLRDPRQQRLHLHPRRGAPRRSAACSAPSQEAYLAGHLGKNIHGSGYDLDVVVHAGAGAYICGEETALLEGLEGRRGQPRLRPPFPAVAGLYASPTVINNVESIASVPSIIAHGADWFASMGTEKSKGYGIFSLSGHVTKPGPVRSPARHHAARADRPRRRHARGPRAEVLDPRRLQHPAADRRAPRRTARLRGRRRGRLDARHPRAADLRRDHLRGPRGAALDRVLQARVLRQVHPVPRGHLVAGADPGPARAGARAARPTSTCCSTSATTSWAARSAPSATAPPARSPARSSTSATSTSPT